MSKDGLEATITKDLWEYKDSQFFVEKTTPPMAWLVYHKSGDVDVDYGNYSTRAEAVAAIQSELGEKPTKKKPPVEKHQCAGKTSGGGGFYRYACAVNAKYFEEGKWWCHHHAPSKELERREKVNAKYRAQREAYESKLDDGQDRAGKLAVLLGVRFDVHYSAWTSKPTGGVSLSSEECDTLIERLTNLLGQDLRQDVSN
jgi:hypothetical protein